ncbi:MAG: hypothetical protein AB9907_14670 [Flexilinea sp.]
MPFDFITIIYERPIYNRSLNDIVVRNSRAFFNVSDWTRINNNTQYARELVLDIKGGLIPHVTLAPPTRTTKPTAADINALVQNIIYVQAAADVTEADRYTLFADYEDGADKATPDFIKVNSWERVLYIIINRYLSLSVGRLLVTGIGHVGSNPTLQNYFRRYSHYSFGRMCVTGVGYCGSEMTIQNYFRR